MGAALPNRPFLSSWRRAAETRDRAAKTTSTSLISVPNLAAGPDDREASSSSLSQRYAAIWTLADQGASPEVDRQGDRPAHRPDRADLGLRRHIDGSRTTIPHAPHA